MRVNGKEIKWKDGPKGDYLTDVKVHTLWEDKKTGANLTLIRAPVAARPVMEWHVHPDANEWSYYLAGEGEYSDGTRITVSADNTVFSYTPKGERHGGEGGKVIREMMWMRYHDGPSKRVIK